MTAWQTARVGAALDVLAPDGSEIRLLVASSRGSLVHCRLPAGQITRAVRHRTVEEVWYCLAGGGQLWRNAAGQAEVVDLAPGVALSIPPGTAFQFRAHATAALDVVITTMPPWPGADEAVMVQGVWQPTS